MAQPTQLNATEQDTLVKQIGLALLRAAPRDWRRITAQYRAVGRYHELSGEVLTEDGSAVEWMATHDIATLFGRLRAGMYREGRGTWFNARYQLDHPSSYNLEYDRDEPHWDLQPPPQAYADELRTFPRSEDNVPEWLMRRMSGLGPEQPGPRFRIARIFDGQGPDGRPIINRPEIDPDERERLLTYLNTAPVALSERGLDLDRLATPPTPKVPVAYHTDGTWLWPAATNYYLNEYGIAPESDLMAHIRAVGFTLTEVPEQTVQAANAYLTRGNQPPPPRPVPAGQAPAFAAAPDQSPNPDATRPEFSGKGAHPDEEPVEGKPQALGVAGAAGVGMAGAAARSAFGRTDPAYDDTPTDPGQGDYGHAQHAAPDEDAEHDSGEPEHGRTDYGRELDQPDAVVPDFTHPGRTQPRFGQPEANEQAFGGGARVPFSPEPGEVGRPGIDEAGPGQRGYGQEQTARYDRAPEQAGPGRGLFGQPEPGQPGEEHTQDPRGQGEETDYDQDAATPGHVADDEASTGRHQENPPARNDRASAQPDIEQPTTFTPVIDPDEGPPTELQPAITDESEDEGQEPTASSAPFSADPSATRLMAPAAGPHAQPGVRPQDAAAQHGTPFQAEAAALRAGEDLGQGGFGAGSDRPEAGSFGAEHGRPEAGGVGEAGARPEANFGAGSDQPDAGGVAPEGRRPGAFRPGGDQPEPGHFGLGGDRSEPSDFHSASDRPEAAGFAANGGRGGPGAFGSGPGQRLEPDAFRAENQSESERSESGRPGHLAEGGGPEHGVPDLPQGEPGRQDFTRGAPRRPDFAEGEPGRPDFALGDPGQPGFTQGEPTRSDLPQREPAMPGLPQREPGRADPRRGEPGRTDVGRGEAGAPGFVRSDPGSPDLTRGEPNAADFARGEPGRPDFARGEPGQADFTRSEPSGVDFARREPGRPDFRSESTRPEFTGGEPGRPDFRSEPGQADFTGGEPGRPDFTRGEPGKPDFTRTEPGRPDLARSEPGQADFTGSEPSGPDFTRGEPGRPDFTRGEPGRPDFTRGEPGRPDFARGEPGRPNLVQGEPGRPDHIRGEPSGLGFGRGEPAVEGLRRRLRDLGVPESAYRIGEPAEHGWSMEHTEAGWRVGWYDDKLTNPAVFGDAEDAAAFMLGKLLLDPRGREASPTSVSVPIPNAISTGASSPGDTAAVNGRVDEQLPIQPPVTDQPALDAAPTMMAPAVHREQLPQRREPTPAQNSGGQWPIQPLPGEPPLTLFRGKEMRELPPGSELDRFGGPNGNLTYAAGTPFEERSLVPEWVSRPYHLYRVQRPLETLAGVAIPWFNQPGGGAAYLLPASIDELVAEGDLVELDPGEPPIE